MKNLHDIAIDLEHVLRQTFNKDFSHSGTIFDADHIELGSFYDVLVIILYIKGKGDYTDFENKLYKFKGINMKDIPNCEKIFEEFKSYL